MFHFMKSELPKPKKGSNEILSLQGRGELSEYPKPGNVIVRQNEETGKWEVARIRKDGTEKVIQSFETEEEARRFAEKTKGASEEAVEVREDPDEEGKFAVYRGDEKLKGGFASKEEAQKYCREIKMAEKPKYRAWKLGKSGRWVIAVDTGKTGFGKWKVVAQADSEEEVREFVKKRGGELVEMTVYPYPAPDTAKYYPAPYRYRPPYLKYPRIYGPDGKAYSYPYIGYPMPKYGYPTIYDKYGKPYKYPYIGYPSPYEKPPYYGYPLPYAYRYRRPNAK